MQVPGDAAGCFLLGKLHSLTDNPSMAVSCYQAALVKDPLLWAAYEGLCQLGEEFDLQLCQRHITSTFHNLFTSHPCRVQPMTAQATLLTCRIDIT